MAIDPPWRLDPLQNIVEVGWGDNSVGFIKTAVLPTTAALFRAYSADGKVAGSNASIPRMECVAKGPGGTFAIGGVTTLDPGVDGFGANVVKRLNSSGAVIWTSTVTP